MKEKELRVTVADAMKMMQEPVQVAVYWRPNGILTHTNSEQDLAIVTVFGRSALKYPAGAALLP